MERRLRDFLLFLIILKGLISPILHSFKLIRFSEEVGDVFFYILLIFIPVTGFLALVVRRRYHVDTIQLCVLWMLCVSLALTAAWGGDITDIGGNVLRVMTVLTVFQVGYQMKFDTEKFKRRLIKTGLIGIAVALAISYTAVFTGHAVYLGLSTEHVFPYLSDMLVGNNLLAALGGFAMIVLGGKRGVMLAGTAMLAFAAFVYKYGVKKYKTIPIFIGIGILVTFFAAIDLKDLPGPVYNRIKPFVEGNQSNSHTAYRDATSGRSEEVFFVINDIKANPSILFTGKGLGATFTDDFGVKDSTVHISPVAITFIFGLPFALIFYFLIFKRFYMLIRMINRLKDGTMAFWVILCLGLFVNSFFVFEVLQNPLLWLSFGISNKLYDKEIAKRKAARLNYN